MKSYPLIALLACLALFAVTAPTARAADGPGSRAPLVADGDVLLTSGGSVSFALNAGPSHAGRKYVLLGSFSGTSPGFPLPGGGILPINWDVLTSFIYQHLGSPRFVGFHGTLDAGGSATATLDTMGPLPPSIKPGWTMHLAFTTYGPTDFQSNPVALAIKAAPNFVYVDDSNTSGVEDGTRLHPFNTIQEGIDAAVPGEQVHVDDSSGIYNETITLKDDVLVVGDNWNPSDGSARPRLQGPNAPGSFSVYAAGVTGGGLTRFDIMPAGISSYALFVNLASCTSLTISDCFFHGMEAPVSMVGLSVAGGSDITIDHCHFAHFHGPDPQSPPASNYYTCILADQSDDLTISNVRMNDIATNFSSNGHQADAVKLTDCDRPVLHNNLVYKIVIKSGKSSAGLATGITLENCVGALLYNNTVDTIDTTDNFMINQAFGYFLRECPQIVFYNNLATNIDSSGFPPPLARGIQGVTDPVACDYTLTWNILAEYYGTAFANSYCVSADPLYVNPANGDHDIAAGSSGQLGDPTFVDWDDRGTPSGNPSDPDTNRRSRMG